MEEGSPTTMTALPRIAPAASTGPIGGLRPQAAARQPDWPAHQRARIMRPLCSAPGEEHQARLPVGCCDIQLTAELALLSWWGRGRKQQITIPAQELRRLLDVGLIEQEAQPI